MKHITGLEATDIVKEFFPDASVEEALRMLWNFTGWPAFWRTDDVAGEIRESIKSLKEKGPEKHMSDAGY